MKNTVLNIKKSGFPKVEKVFNVKTIEDLFNSINEVLEINPLAETINVKKCVEISGQVNDWKNKYGFDFYNYDKGIIRFRGYRRWVYFYKSEPVLFDSSCSGTDTKPHTISSRLKEYDTLLFDDCKLINI